MSNMCMRRAVIFFLLLSATSFAAGQVSDAPEPVEIEGPQTVEPADGPNDLAGAEVSTGDQEAAVPETTEDAPIAGTEPTHVAAPDSEHEVSAEPEAPVPVEPELSDEDRAELPEPDFVGPPAPPVETPDEEADEGADRFVILDQALEPGELRQFNWQLDTAMAGLAVPVPVLVAHGSKPGPTLCLVAAVHGDELNGVEIVRRIMFDIDLDKLAGNIVGVPIANSFGFLRSSRYLPDRRDLNRYFPGDADGSMASRFAYSLFNQIVRHCNVLVDIHTGSFYRTNLPQLRADLRITRVLHLTKQFGDIAVLHTVGPSGSLRRAATDAGIAAVTMETGGPARFQEGAVSAGVKAIEALLNHLDMIKRFRLFGEPQPVIYDSTWVRAQTGGILLGEVGLGDTVDKGQRLGTVTDPIQNKREILRSPFRGRLLGMAVNQVVMPGFAAFHIGRAADERAAIGGSTAGRRKSTTDDHLDDTGGYTDEDEFFDPFPAEADEQEPENVTEPSDVPVEQVPEDFEVRFSARNGIGWLQPEAERDPPGCIRPPLLQCAD